MVKIVFGYTVHDNQKKIEIIPILLKFDTNYKLSSYLLAQSFFDGTEAKIIDIISKFSIFKMMSIDNLSELSWEYTAFQNYKVASNSLKKSRYCKIRV